ncbi:PorE family type IX secretion system protein [Prevotella sp.]|uniref:PorE family type IX secretion system protein n=1 Tax=Prevotella sp. TaxID=59823 RepID=UPI0026495206|nr:OmpA family protein [Prevotella sp.]MDN5553521.1 OmpA family protein [Prevotella sp.]
MRKFYIIYIFTALCLFASCGAERSLKKAEEHLALGEYYDAATMFRKAYQQTPAKNRDERGLYAVKMARCYAKINQTKRALAAFQNAERYNHASNSDKLTLARMMLKDAQYKNAEKIFLSLKDSLPNDILVKNGLISAQKAVAWKKQGSRYTVKRMNLFNSNKGEYCPKLQGDRYSQIYFTSTRNTALGNELSGITGAKNGDIFLSEKDDKGKWNKPEAISGSLNTEYDEGACDFSPDGKTMYITQCTTDPLYPRYAKILTSQRSDASWSKATELPISRDTLSSFAHPAISPDGNWIYFTSDMPGGKGGLDIWRIRITPAGLGGVEDLDSTINTPGNEEFPSFRPNGDLYFSSDGHPGMGGLDIFIAKTDKNTGKIKVEHPGYPLNSADDDFGITFEGPHNRGFFSSNRYDGKGYDHIYSFENPEIIQTIKGWVYEIDGYELPKSQVYMIGNDGTNLKLSVKGDGSFTQTVSPGVDYVLLATCDGFLNHKEEINIGSVKESKEYTLQFPLASIAAPVLIDNIFYDLNKASLRPESATALDKLVTLLNENPHVTIELSANCDYRGGDEYNKNLSQKRAETVVRYLISKGIAADRLTPVGYGKENPKTIKKKITEKYDWLKEGDRLTAEYIKKLSNDKQEICNQLNRRTEFRVIRTTYGLFDKNGNLKELPKTKNKNKDADAEIYF